MRVDVIEVGIVMFMDKMEPGFPDQVDHTLIIYGPSVRSHGTLAMIMFILAKSWLIMEPLSRSWQIMVHGTLVNIMARS